MPGRIRLVRTFESRLGFGWGLGLLVLLVVLGYVLFREVTGSPIVNAKPAPPATTTPTTPTTLVGNPSEAPLRCASSWVTQLGSWRPTGDGSTARNVFDTLRDVQQRAAKNGMSLRLHYTWAGTNQCSAIPRNFYLLWSGPYPNAAAAKQVCNRLGWTKANDDNKCYGRTIDPARKDKKIIRPDGTYR